jgi:CheY-like chemotaxis protein
MSSPGFLTAVLELPLQAARPVSGEISLLVKLAKERLLLWLTRAMVGKVVGERAFDIPRYFMGPIGNVGVYPELRMSGMSYRGSEMKKSCVLLAQDNPINQEVGRTMIEALGCRVDVASNGCEVLTSMESGSYDLVLMDCRMAVMDGLEAARLIRSREQTRGGPRTALIAVAAAFTEEDRSRCLDAGMDDCIVKPFYICELLEMITRWCNRFIWP